MYLYLRHSSLFRITKEDHISHPFPQYVLKRVLQWLNSNMDIRKSRCRDQAGCPFTVLNLKFQRLSIFFWKSQESDPILGIASPEGHSVWKATLKTWEDTSITWIVFGQYRLWSEDKLFVLVADTREDGRPGTVPSSFAVRLHERSL